MKGRRMKGKQSDGKLSRGRPRSHTVRRPLAVFLAIALPACGGGGGSPTTPTAAATPAPTPTPPAAAVLTLGVERPTTWTITSESNSIICGDISSRFIMIESAGLGGELVRSDAFVQWADGDIEGRRVTDQGLRFAPNSQTTLAVDRFECAIKRNELPGRVILKLSVVDDRGNEIALEATADNWERR